MYAVPTGPLFTRAVELSVKSYTFSSGDRIKAPLESLNSTLDWGLLQVALTKLKSFISSVFGSFILNVVPPSTF